MSARPSTYSDILTFSSAKPLPYGQNITIFENPVRQNGQWVANALFPTSEFGEIILNTDQLIGKNYIIVRTEPSGSRYSHTAVLMDEINRESRKTEENIARLLNRI